MNDGKYLQIRNSDRVDFIVRFILTLLIAGMLVAPAAILLTVKKPKWQVVIVLCFTLAFSMMLHVTTRAKRHEQFAAASGTCRL